MRFPRFHYRIAISLGLTMLCMSMVPVFGDGLIAPSLSVSANGSTVYLSWNRPGGTVGYMLRRSTSAAPTNTSEGDLITTLTGSILSHQETLANGTYYFSIFATDGTVYSGAGSAGPITIAMGRGGNSWLKQIRLSNGLDDKGYPLVSSSSSLISSALSSIDSSASSFISSLQSSSSSKAEHSAATVDPKQKRICDRVMKWFSNNPSVLERVNERLLEHFGFTCEK